MLELNVSGSVPFCFYCIQWFLLIILLSLSQILWSLLWKPKFKVGTFEIQHPLFIYRLYLPIFMAELSLMFRVELPSICPKTYIGLIRPSWSFRIRNWLDIMCSRIRCHKLALIVSKDKIGVGILIGLCSCSLCSIVCFIVAGREISQSISKVNTDNPLINRLILLSLLLNKLILIIGPCLCGSESKNNIILIIAFFRQLPRSLGMFRILLFKL